MKTLVGSSSVAIVATLISAHAGVLRLMVNWWPHVLPGHVIGRLMLLAMPIVVGSRWLLCLPQVLLVALLGGYLSRLAVVGA